MGFPIPCASSLQVRHEECHHFGAVRLQTTRRTQQQAANPAERNEGDTIVPGGCPCGDEVHGNGEKERGVQPSQVYAHENHSLRASLNRHLGPPGTTQTERADGSLDR